MNLDSACQLFEVVRENDRAAKVLVSVPPLNQYNTPDYSPKACSEEAQSEGRIGDEQCPLRLFTIDFPHVPGWDDQGGRRRACEGDGEDDFEWHFMTTLLPRLSCIPLFSR